VNTLLTELDGLDARKSVYVIAATNRPDMIDPAMVRPGRLDKLLYVDLPSSSERVEILRTLVRRVPLHGDTNEVKAQENQAIELLIRERCDGYSGADLAALVREAGVTALKRTLGAMDDMDDSKVSTDVFVGSTDFFKALDKVRPSVSVSQRKRYQNLQSKYAGLPVGVVATGEAEK
jgi:ribosome biogenesis ATPase